MREQLSVLCGYKRAGVAKIGICELRSDLSKFLNRVREGEELIVTNRGVAIAKVVPIDDRGVHDTLVSDGLIEPSDVAKRPRPATRMAPTAPVSTLVADQPR
jgi:prevent-host-death family protein